MEMQVERSLHDLSKLSFQTGEIGRLQTLGVTPVLPGDGYSADIVGAIRLSPLRRGLSVDSVVDIVSFYVPHRHIYSNWVDFIEDGYDESITLGTETAPAAQVVSCLGTNSFKNGAALPKWLPEGYRQIWNRYFRPPTTISEYTDLASTWGADMSKYGKRCAHLKHIWTAMLENSIVAADYEVDTTGDKLSLLDLEQQQGYLRTEQEREFFNTRYADIVKSFGGFTNFSADDRPVLLMRSTTWASGYDVDGTDQTTLGQFSGRVVQGVRHRVPRYFVPEHGAIWHMALVRFPPVHFEEQHYLVNNPEPTYAEISGDPAIVATQPPHGITLEDHFSESSDSTVQGYIPFGQWYRTDVSVVHNDYDALSGYPFLETVPADQDAMILVQPTEYDAMFQTTQLAHWQMQCRINQPVMRRLPSSRSSLLTGA